MATAPQQQPKARAGAIKAELTYSTSEPTLLRVPQEMCQLAIDKWEKQGKRSGTAEDKKLVSVFFCKERINEGCFLNPKHKYIIGVSSGSTPLESLIAKAGGEPYDTDAKGKKFNLSARFDGSKLHLVMVPPPKKDSKRKREEEAQAREMEELRRQVAELERQRAQAQKQLNEERAIRRKLEDTIREALPREG